MMARGRLRALEGSLSPTESVLCWLAEARTFPSLGEYAASTIEVPAAATPLERIIERVGLAVRREHRGEPRAAVSAATDAAVLAALTRYELVLRLNAVTIEQTEHLALRLRSLIGAFKASEPVLPTERQGALGGPLRSDRARVALFDQLNELVMSVAVEDRARALLERAYLDGANALFADAARSWQALADDATSAHRAWGGERPGRRGRAARRGTGSLARRAQERAGAIAADARLAAATILGERERATEILRSRLGRGPDSVEPLLAIRALERTSRPIRLAAPSGVGEPAGLSASAHPLDGLSDSEKARQLHLIAAELEALP